MNLNDLKMAADKYLVPNYGTRSIALVRGQGQYVWDSDGLRYLDMLAGIAVCGLGHCHPAVTKAIQEQAAQLVHCSNLYLIPQQVELAHMLVESSFAQKVFFCNSGAEANEAALKLAKIYAQQQGHAHRYEVVSLQDSFHGRTIATLSATGQARLQEGFKPLLPGFTFVPRNDIHALMDAVTDKTCTIILELVQGEGGVHPLGKEYVKAVRDLCNSKDIVLILDEVQTGMGRTGTLWAHQQYDIEPDILTTAKGLANGFPMAAMLTTAKLAAEFSLGKHGSTFGGNPLACAASLATLKVMLEEDYPGRAKELGALFSKKLKTIKRDFKTVSDVRGLGLMLALECERAKDIYEGLLERHILANLTGGGRVVRFLPPMVITEEDIDTVIEAIRDILKGGSS